MHKEQVVFVKGLGYRHSFAWTLTTIKSHHVHAAIAELACQLHNSGATFAKAVIFGQRRDERVKMNVFRFFFS